jgi:aspartate racemase
VARTIGICTATIEGGVICHQEVGREATRRGIDYPEIVTHTPKYAAIRKAVEDDELSELPATLIHSINLMAAAGAELAIIPSNTMHLVFDKVSPQCNVPLLHIASVAAEFCRSSGFRKVGVLGTASTMRRRLFDAHLHKVGVAAVYPPAGDMEMLTTIIARELIKGIFKQSSIDELAALTTRMAKEADALILGCTELPLVLTADNCAAPLIDTTRLLARAALTAAVS